MATEISSIGKEALLSRLFEGSGWINERGCAFSGDGDFSTVHKVFMEKVDFDLTYNPLRHLGHKLALNVIGELYAGMYSPVGMDVVVALSNRFSAEDVQDLWEGISAAAKEHGAGHLALDLIPSAAGMVVSIAAWGSAAKEVTEKRKKAQSKDLLVLSGDLGAAYMGLHVLEREKAAFQGTPAGAAPKQPDLSQYKYIVGEYLSPYLKPDIPGRFSEAGIIPCGGYFVSRGLGDAAKRIAADTGLGVKIYIGRIPIASKTFEMAQELNLDPVTAAVNGGDDYRLLYIVPLEFHETLRRDFQDWDIIGHLAHSDVGEVLVTPEGAEIGIHAQGYEQ